MNDIRWLESHPNGKLLARLLRFDHHRIEIDGEPAVLMTYVNKDHWEGGLLAVVHPAADRYPAVPARVRDAMAKLDWEPTAPPSRGMRGSR